ncbi:uncharacterized protein LOC128945405 [Melozone crissalis]|uniref:uncharacterized protein LOC128945405 n=1 Tax=Melozone crissalis TaxID=40204 RepID=UPI0023DBE023|nr:uncharacterized protein LOC128945405 [Melozone crissalis]
MHLSIWTAVLLGLILTPALADYSQQSGNNCQVSVGGVFQNLTLSSLTRVVVIEQRSNQFSWKTVWNYNTGIIATKLVQQNTCYISVMNRNEMPSFENLAHMASQNGNQMGLGRPSKKITFVTNGLVNNLSSYGIEISAMCSGLTTYMATEVHRPQVNLGSCITLDVLRIVELDYCGGNGNWNGNIPSQQIPGGIFNNTQGNIFNNTQVIIGGRSQIVTINRQWRVAIIEQRSFTGSWRTIWNYNTGIIATKVIQQNTCYISIMNRNEMPSFNNLARLAEESKNQFGLGRPTKKITFVTNGLVSNLRSYGSDVFSMCSGLTTYMTYEVHGVQANLGSCITLDVLGVVDFKYCTGYGNDQSQQIPGGIFNNTQGSQTHVVIIGGQSQIVTINRQWRVAIIEQTSISGSWKTIWNYNTGVIASKVTQQNACYISIMNRNEMPSFENLAHLAEESKNQFGLGRPTRKITFVTNGLVSNLRSYGSDVFSMCSGLTTYMTYEVHGVQANLGSCITLDVLGVVDLKYCTGNGNDQGSQTHVVIIGGQSQIVTINRQWRVAIIEQTSISGSWKTIWNYNTGIIATKVTQQNTCYISIMNRNEMLSFNNLVHLAEETKNQFGLGRPTKKITFVTNGLVSNLRSYGSDVFSMCSGLTTYMTYEVHGVQVNLGSCITLDVLGVVDLKYCTGNGNDQGSQTHVVIIGGHSQIVTINRQWRVAIIEQTSISGSWKTIWNYNTGIIATKVTQQNTCYISIMNRNEMLSFNNLVHLAEETKNQFGLGRPTRKITFVTNGLVSNLMSYGSDVFSMCSGLTTYMTYEVHGVQVNLGSCITLDVLGVVDLKYCTGNGNDQGSQTHVVIIGGHSQIVTINRQWRVAIIEQTSISGSWKTIWNYNTGIIATKVTQQNTCYISIMNRNEMLSFNNLVHLAEETKNQFGLGRPTKKITFVTNGLVSNLRSYGSDVFSMCSGLTTYMTYEVHGVQVNLGSCITLDVLGVVDLKYCTGNGNDQGSQTHVVIIGGHSQIVTINRQWRVAIIEQTSISGSWKTIWNYNTGIIATKVTQQNTCYISIMNRNEMLSFNNLAQLAEESKNQFGLGRPTKKITFVTNGLVSNLRSYGSDVFSMCSGLTTYMAYEVHGHQVNLGSCITLDVLRVVDLKYCTGNGNGQSQQIPGGEGNSHLVIIGGQSQIVTINRQWRVAIIEKKAGIGSWKTIWNYNTGIIVTKVTQQNACYISTMNRNEMPLYDNLAHLAQESKNQFGLGRPTKKITFVTNGLVSNLRSYGSDVFSMCSGLTTYMTYEVHGVQVNLGSCITLDVLRVVDLKYCTGNGNDQGSQTHVVIIGGQSQIVTINRQWRVAVIEQRSFSKSWKTIWNYNTGIIVTKVTQQNACYISTMNRNEIPRFDNLVHLAELSRNQFLVPRPTKEITFVTNGLVSNLRSYGSDVFSMCSGLTTYMTYEVHGVQVNLGSCITLDVLGVVDLKYCTGNGNDQQIPGGIFNNTQVIIGGNSQIVTINRQWRVAVIEQRSFSGSWKTIWNYNTGVIVTKVTQENACYISTMNRNEMPRFDNLAHLAEESKNHIGFGRPTKKITFVASALVNNLRSYGSDVFAMCSGLTTYMTYEVHGVQGPQVNLGSCITLDVLQVVDLHYCSGNFHGNGQVRKP